MFILRGREAMLSPYLTNAAGIDFAWAPRMRAGVPGVLAAVLWLGCGCTALGVSVAGLGGAMIGAGAGAAVKAGTEYGLSGAVMRTFTVPLPEIHAAAMETFERLDIDWEPQGADDASDDVVGHAGNRTVRIRLEALTHVLTRVRVTVTHAYVIKDVATADEILAQLAAVVDQHATAAPSRHARE
jgi:hypothetical protein